MFCNNLVFSLVVDTVTTMVQGCNNPGIGLLQPCCNKMMHIIMQQNERKNFSFSLWLLILLLEELLRGVDLRKGRRKKLFFSVAGTIPGLLDL